MFKNIEGTEDQKQAMVQLLNNAKLNNYFK